MRHRPDPPPPPKEGGAPARADFDRVFDRYADLLWAALARHVSATELPRRVERPLTGILLHWADGLRGPELEGVAIALLRQELEAVRRAAEGAGAQAWPLRASPPASGSDRRGPGALRASGAAPSSRRTPRG